MSAINDIISTLDSLYQEGGDIEVSPEAFSGSPDAQLIIRNFLNDALREENLVITNPDQPDIEDFELKITITGYSQYLDYKNPLYVHFIVYGSTGDTVVIELNGDLKDPKGNYPDQTPPIPVVTWLSMQNARYKIVWDSTTRAVDSSYVGNLYVEQYEGYENPDLPNPYNLELTLELQPTNGEAWALQAIPWQDTEISAQQQLVWILTGNEASAFFPSGLLTLDNILLNSVYTRFNPIVGDKGFLEVLSADFICNKPWILVRSGTKDLLRLKRGMQFGLSIQSSARPGPTQYIGTILASFDLGGIDISVYLQADFLGQWSIGIQQFSPVVIPSIVNLMDLISDTAVEQLPSGLSTIPGIEIDTLNIVFNPSTPSFDALEFAVQTTSTWVIFPDYFEIHQFSIEVAAKNIYVPDPDSNPLIWEFYLDAGFRIGEIWLNCTLLKPEEGDWELTVSIPQEHPLTLQAMAATLMPGIEIPEQVPNFGILGDPDLITIVFSDTPTFHLSAKSSSDWVINETFSFQNFYISFDYEGNNQISGTASMSFNVATDSGQITIFLKTSLDNTANGGWHFKGSATFEGVKVTNLVDAMASALGMDTPQVPTPIADATVKGKVDITYDTRTSDFSFHAQVDLSEDLTAQAETSGSMKMALDVEFRHNSDGSYEDLYRGTLILTPDTSKPDKTLLFQVEFLESTSAGLTSDTFFAVFHDSAGITEINIGQLVGLFSTNLGNSISQTGLVMGLHDVLFVCQNSGDEDATTKFLFGLNWDLGLNLSNLPLVGQLLAPDQTMVVEFQVLVASQNISKEETQAINKLLPEPSTPLPENENGIIAWDSEDPEPHPLSTKVVFGGDGALELDLPVWISSNNETPGLTTNPDQAEGKPNIDPLEGETTDPRLSGGNVNNGLHWFKVQKSWGPLYLDRIAGTVKDGKVSFGLAASLSMLGLEVALDGLTITNPLTSFDPTFGLDGIGVGYHAEGIGLQGALLRKTVTDSYGTYDMYNGGAVLTLPKLSLAALGSYASLPPQTVEGLTYSFAPSLFVYAVLDAPLFAQPYFYINGLAAGFGFNRDLIPPSINNVINYPLVSIATGGPAATTVDGLDQALSELDAYIPPQVGQVFLAMGIKFGSFNLIDAFALLTVSVGKARIEATLLGLGTAVLPTPVKSPAPPPLAEIQIQLLARIAPTEGVISVEGQLTSASFIFSRDCHLTGGFALMAWFSPLGGGSNGHEGEFVLSLGGYHPDFHRAYYPVPPRIGIRWNVTEEITIKGEAYCALTPTAMMAGGRLEAVYDDGSIRAWYIVGADFFIGWQPFHYFADMYIDVGASYTFDHFGITQTVTFDVGAELSVWGPDFSGYAKVNYSVVSFTIEFGSLKKAVKPPALVWDEFQDAFLPPLPSSVDGNDDEGNSANYGEVWLNISAVDGIVDKEPTEINTKDLGTVNPQTLVLNASSCVPLKSIEVDGGHDDDKVTTITGEELFGIRPMDITGSEFADSSESKLSVSVDYHNGSTSSVAHEFEYEAVYQNLPAAMWGVDALDSKDLQASSMVPGLLIGLTIRPAASLIENPVKDLSNSKMIAWEVTSHAYEWEDAIDWALSGTDDPNAREKAITDSLNDPNVAETRSQLLDALGLAQMDVDVDGTLSNGFREVPQTAGFGVAL